MSKIKEQEKEIKKLKAEIEELKAELSIVTQAWRDEKDIVSAGLFEQLKERDRTIEEIKKIISHI